MKKENQDIFKSIKITRKEKHKNSLKLKTGHIYFRIIDDIEINITNNSTYPIFICDERKND